MWSQPCCGSFSELRTDLEFHSKKSSQKAQIFEGEVGDVEPAKGRDGIREEWGGPQPQREERQVSPCFLFLEGSYYALRTQLGVTIVSFWSCPSPAGTNAR